MGEIRHTPPGNLDPSWVNLNCLQILGVFLFQRLCKLIVRENDIVPFLAPISEFLFLPLPQTPKKCICPLFCSFSTFLSFSQAKWLFIKRIQSLFRFWQFCPIKALMGQNDWKTAIFAVLVTFSCRSESKSAWNVKIISKMCSATSNWV